MAIGAVVARILTQYSDKGSKAAQKDITKLGKQFDDFAKKTTRAFGLATAAVGAFAIKLGKDAVKGAMEDQKAQIALATALRNTVGANDAAIESTVKYLDKLELATGVNNNELIPSLQKLVTATGDITTAQRLQQIALDTSAGTTKDLGAVTEAFARALGGNLTALKRLAPTMDASIVKNKDLAAAFEYLSKTYGGQAAARAETLEFRFLRLQLAFDQALDSLGYAFIPVLEDFVKTLTKDVLPAVSTWVELNKRQLAEGLKVAAKAALDLLKQIIKIGAWVVANFESIKNFGILLASIWATARIYSFIAAVGKVTLAFKGMQAAAIGAGAAAAGATGTSGAAAAFMAGARSLGLVGIGATAITGLTLGLGKIDLPGTRTRAKRLAAEREARLAGYQGSPGPSDLATINAAKSVPTKDNSMKEYLDFLNKLQNMQNKLTGSKKKELTTEQKIINAMLKKYGLTLMTSEIEAKATATAIEANLKKQNKLGLASPTISLLSAANAADQGTLGNGLGNPVVNVNITTPYGTKDDFVVDINNDLNTLQRRRGRGVGAGIFLFK